MCMIQEGLRCDRARFCTSPVSNRPIVEKWGASPFIASVVRTHSQSGTYSNPRRVWIDWQATCVWDTERVSSGP
jgi:hypothetical protein